MAGRSATLPEDGRRGQPLLLVLIGDAAFETIVFDGPFTAVEACRQRSFRGTLRRVGQVVGQVVRRTCAHPSCDRPVDECQLDHVTAHSRGGATSQDDQDLDCGPHNRMKSDLPPEEWAAQVRTPDVWRPHGLDDP